jgi:hypothetical protein
MPKARVIALYLPQFHPVPENDAWWGKGFTEWTNVGKAKPLFRGHYQPRVPADLGYYDLRLPEVRQAQADLAQQHGIEGFCYWHYWFGNGKRMLERPFNEVLVSGKPDFPFCLAWANASWEDKLFNKDGSKKILLEQTYPGEKDCINHFYKLLPAFRDKRYICVDNKPLFMIYSPFDIPGLASFIILWNNLAKKNGLKGIHLVAQTYDEREIGRLLQQGFDAVNIIRLFHFFKKDYSFPERCYMKTMRLVFGKGRIVPYKRASRFFIGEEDNLEYCYPTIIPNWDHSPRTGRSGHILTGSTPELFALHVRKALEAVGQKEEQHRLIFLKSWNEWAEGNYMEPDLKFGRKYLEALKKELDGMNTKPA